MPTLEILRYATVDRYTVSVFLTQESSLDLTSQISAQLEANVENLDRKQRDKMAQGKNIILLQINRAINSVI